MDLITNKYSLYRFKSRANMLTKLAKNVIVGQAKNFNLLFQRRQSTMNGEKRSGEAAVNGKKSPKYKTEGKKDSGSASEEPIDPEVTVLYKKKKRKKIIIAVSIIGAAGILFSGGYLFYQNTPGRVIARSQIKAESFSAEKNYSAAAAELQRILELDDKNIQAYLDISQAYLQQNMTDKAVDALRTGYELTGDSKIKERLNELLKIQALEQGNKYLSEKKYKQATEEFQKVLDADKKCAEAYAGKADAYVGLNETDNALLCLQSGIDETDDEELKTKLNEIKIKQLLDNADRLYSQEEYDEARKEYKNVLIIDDKNTEAYLGMANSLLAMDNEDGAAEILAAGLEKTKDRQIENKLNELQVSVYLKSAQQYLEDEEYDLALEELKKAIDVNDKCIQAYLTYADICDSAEQIDEVVELLQTGFDKTSDERIKAKLDEFTVLQCLNKAEEYLFYEEYENAKFEYEKALELDEKCAEAYLGLADYYGRMGSQDEATDILEKGYEITKDGDISARLEQIQISAMLWQASSCYNQGDYLEAVNEYNSILDIVPYNVDAYLGAANAYIRLGRNDDAIDILQTGYNYTGNNTILSKLISLRKDPHLNLANRYLSNRDYANAAEEFRAVLKIDYYCIEAYLGLADAYVGLGRMLWADETLEDGYAATGSKEIEFKMYEIRFNNVSLSPQTSSYEPLNSMVKQILSQITTGGMSTYQKVKACYDYLIDNGRYGHASDSYFDSGDMANERRFAEKSAYAFLKDGVGNCLNYNAAFTAMTRAIGLKTILRTGETPAIEGGYTSHTWCEIQLNGTIYVFDPQLEDNYARGAPTPYIFFCKTYDQVRYTHYAEGYYSMF